MSQKETESTKGGWSRRKLLGFGGVLAALGIGGGGLYRYFSSRSTLNVESFMTTGDGRSKNILMLSGGARSGGNSEALAAAFLSGAKNAGHETMLYNCAQMPMTSCMHCDLCWHNNSPCIMNDNFNELWPMLEKADMLVLASPLYWYNFSGHLKCALDRLYPYSSKHRKRDLPIRETMLLMCGESHFPRSFAGAAESYRQILGLKGWKDRGRLFVTGVHDKGAMTNHKALAVAEKMGAYA